MSRDPNLTIEGTCQGGELDKRTYLPGVVIKSKCPECDAPYVKDLENNYLSYPKVGQPYKLTGYCGQCDHEWPLGEVVLNLTITMV